MVQEDSHRSSRDLDGKSVDSRGHAGADSGKSKSKRGRPKVKMRGHAEAASQDADQKGGPADFLVSA